MKKLHVIFLTALLIPLMTGCVSTNLVGDVDPSVDLASIQTFYVVRQPKDKRGIEKMISDELLKYGKESSFGNTTEPPEGVDAVVTYIDKWYWDLTNYLIELTIEMRHPETRYKMASGKSFRTSLARKSPEGMVEEVIGEIFGSSDNDD